jgi:hypothetical protein
VEGCAHDFCSRLMEVVPRVNAPSCVGNFVGALIRVLRARLCILDGLGFPGEDGAVATDCVYLEK